MAKSRIEVLKVIEGLFPSGLLQATRVYELSHVEGPFRLSILTVTYTASIFYENGGISLRNVSSYLLRTVRLENMT